MTAPSYASDLTLIDNAEAESTWSELSDAAWDDSVGGPSDEEDYWIYSDGTPNQCISCTVTKVGVASMVANYGSGITWTSGDCVFVWQYFGAPNALDTYAAGGQRTVIGSGLADFNSWDTGGKDRFPNPKGGWWSVAVDPEETPDDTVGSPSATAHQYFGGATKSTLGIGKGNPFGLDIIRYGRGELIVEFGAVADGYATFAGIAAADDIESARWGLMQYFGTGYLWKGLLSLGTSTNAVDMRDSNVTVTVDDTPKATGGTFNAIVVTNSGSNVEWVNVSLKALGTYCPGTFTMAANATVVLTSCTFDGMGAFTFLSNGDAIGCRFLSCGLVYSEGGEFQNTQISGYEGTAGTSAFEWNAAANPEASLAGMSFTKGTAETHAIEFGDGIPSTIALSNCDFSGYSASDSVNGSTFYFADTAGTITLNLSGCTGNFTYDSAGCTVDISSDVGVKFDGMKDNTEVRVYAAGTSTELDGIENATAGTPNNRNFTAYVASSTSVDYWIFAVGYVAIKVKAFSWPATAQTINVQQIIDRNYSNP